MLEVYYNEQTELKRENLKNSYAEVIHKLGFSASVGL